MRGNRVVVARVCEFFCRSEGVRMLRSGGALEAVHTGLARLVSRGNSRQDSGEVWGNALQSCPNFVGYSDRSVA